jgi:two-component system, OmpR family, response regulator MprA
MEGSGLAGRLRSCCAESDGWDQASVTGAAILVVDDDAPIRRMLERTLAAERYVVQTAVDGGDALAAIERAVPELILLDVAMPGLDGLSVCRRLRTKGLSTPVLLLTARDEIADLVDGLDAGADDYLVKPFSTEELLARIRALLRRGREPAGLLALGDLTLDTASRAAQRGNRTVSLTARESQLLELLLRNPRRVVTREQAITQVWDGSSRANTVDRTVTNLRRKLGRPSLIETIRGVGFRLS